MRKRKSRLMMLMMLLLISVQYASAAGKESVKNVSYKVVGNKYVITYDLEDDAVISLSLNYTARNSTVKTKKLFELGKNENVHVVGDIGYVKAGTYKIIEWDRIHDDDIPDLLYADGFEVIAKNIFNPVKTTILGTFGYSFTPKQMSYGLLVGVTSTKNGWGGFVHLRSNYNFGVKSKATCDADGKINGLSCFYTGETKYLYLMANAGVMYNLLSDKRSKSMLALALGAGYGQRNVYWQMDNKYWALNKDLTNRGVSAELNVIGSIKGFTMMAGVNTINFKYVELEVGVGVTF